VHRQTSDHVDRHAAPRAFVREAFDAPASSRARCAITRALAAGDARSRYCCRSPAHSVAESCISRLRMIAHAIPSQEARCDVPSRSKISSTSAAAWRGAGLTVHSRPTGPLGLAPRCRSSRLGVPACRGRRAARLAHARNRSRGGTCGTGGVVRWSDERKRCSAHAPAFARSLSRAPTWRPPRIAPHGRIGPTRPNPDRSTVRSSARHRLAARSIRDPGLPATDHAPRPSLARKAQTGEQPVRRADRSGSAAEEGAASAFGPRGGSRGARKLAARRASSAQPARPGACRQPVGSWKPRGTPTLGGDRLTSCAVPD